MHVGIPELIFLLLSFGVPIFILCLPFLYLKRISDCLERIEEKLDRIKR